jgi:hypothetical protein
MRKAVNGFLPSQNGLHYFNDWPSVPDVRISTPFGQIGIGDASNGLCGGMAFAVRDLFEAHRLPPASSVNPDTDSPAFSFIVSRLLDSFNDGVSVAQYYEWMNPPTHDTWFGPHGTSWRTHQRFDADPAFHDRQGQPDDVPALLGGQSPSGHRLHRTRRARSRQ